MRSNFSEEFWETLQLKHNAISSSLKIKETECFSQEILGILNHGCGATFSQSANFQSRLHRTVPSAGSIYPYEVFVATRTSCSLLNIYVYQPISSSLLLYKECDVYFDDLAAALTTNSNQHVESLDFMILVINRPWASMRKYGERGIIYSFLDCAHAAMNIALIGSMTTAYDPIIDTHNTANELLEILDLEESCSLVQNIIYFPSQTPHAPKTESNIKTESLVRPARVSKAELENWTLLKDEGISTPFPIQKELTNASGAYSDYWESDGNTQFIDCCASDSRFDSVSLLHENARRRSVSSFKQSALTLDQLRQTLCHSTYAVRRFISNFRFRGIGLRLIVKNIAGISGVYDYSFEKKLLQKIDDTAPDTDFRPACMNQVIAQNAAALIILYGPIRKLLLVATIAEIKEAIFSAGQIGQMLYLSATAANVGISAIGGFDSNLCKKLAILDDEFDPVYVLSIGSSELDAAKTDRNRHVGY